MNRHKTKYWLIDWSRLSSSPRFSSLSPSLVLSFFFFSSTPSVFRSCLILYSVLLESAKPLVIFGQSSDNQDSSIRNLSWSSEYNSQPVYRWSQFVPTSLTSFSSSLRRTGSRVSCRADAVYVQNRRPDVGETSTKRKCQVRNSAVQCLQDMFDGNLRGNVLFWNLSLSKKSKNKNKSGNWQGIVVLAEWLFYCLVRYIIRQE